MTEESSVERQPAPGALRLVQLFINTNDIEVGEDRLGTPGQLQGWLLEHNLYAGDSTVTQEAFERALTVREALRDLALDNNGGGGGADALDALDRASVDIPLCLTFEEGCNLVPFQQGVDGALGRLLSIVYDAMRDGTWSRLKACRADDCRWVFYDRSRNHSGTWCTMATCGDREKARAYRRRRKASA